MKIDYKRLIIFILVPLLLGVIVGTLSVTGSSIDSILPSWIFPVVWSILYILMGISSYIIYNKTFEIDNVYKLQLIVNFIWPFIFFKFKLYILAFIWILFLILLVLIMIRDYLSKDKLAGWLQIPYLIWLVIALFLTFTFIV